MKKVILAVALLIAGGGVGGYFYYKHFQNEEWKQNIRSNQWKIEKITDFKIQGMNIDNDTLLTEPLEALIIRKIEQKDLNGQVTFNISSSPISLEDLKQIEIRISNGNVVVNDTLSIVKKDNYKLEGIAELSTDKISCSSDSPNDIIPFLKSLYHKKELKIEIKPDFCKEEIGLEWQSVSY